jgi:hypothetical protein
MGCFRLHIYLILICEHATFCEGLREGNIENFNTTTIKELIDLACRKGGIKACDFYVIYGGKCLKVDKPIAYYLIFKDSIVHLRSRLRAGR